jgi:predicted nucleic acid-binding protein
MTVYLDSTLVIRQLVGTKSPWQGWGTWSAAYASALMRTECYRTANLLRLSGKLDDAQRARLGAWIERVCESVTIVPVTDGVLRRAADAFPTAVGTAQAIHLATLLELQSAHGITCRMATADDELLRAAESMGFGDALNAPPEPAPAPEEAAPSAAAADTAANAPAGA